ncbi:phospholipase A1 VesT1.02-like [Neodiprion virginianus]|uniref:phospholipase A1 VesT1.02-like n=1 Tax=Neodiprion virginianus TaxID=2961670 RepID=UPI001EE701C6|nr:phospholipase A1 VesT1.02-like [Neodiprion virginianus]
MKLLLIAVLAITASVYAGEVIEPEHDYMYFPDGDGVPQLIDLLEKGEDLTGFDSSDSILSRNVETITFNLFTRNNPRNSQLLVLNSVSSISGSNWSSSRPTRFITHGWRSNQNSDACITIRDAYLAEGDYNVIVIDWSSIAGALYVSASSSVRGVAARVSLMINFLSANAGLNVASTKLVGHSLGAHVSGIAARNAEGTIDAVIGLDPALPLFNSAGAGSRIHQTDADHVQIIHTNGGLLGIMDAIGDTDFYPNGGSSQPGCGLDLVGSCAHSRAYYFFAESIRNPTGFRATGTRSMYLEALERHNEVYMGGRVFNKFARGSFTLETARQSPYALG